MSFQRCTEGSYILMDGLKVTIENRARLQGHLPHANNKKGSDMQVNIAPRYFRYMLGDRIGTDP